MQSTRVSLISTKRGGYLFSNKYMITTPRSPLTNFCRTAARRDQHHAERSFATSAMRKQEQDHYAVMGLSPESTAYQIKMRYFQLSKMYHPDVNKGGQEVIDKFHRIQAAYDILGKPQERRNYDRKRSGVQSTSQQHGYPGAPHRAHPTAHHGPSMRARKRHTNAWAGVRSQPLEMGFSPRSSWHPEFRQFFDDWAEKMKKSGLDPTKTTLGYDGRSPNPQLLEQMMDGGLLAQYMRKMRAEGKDPLSTIFTSPTARNSNAGQWLKNRMAMLEREDSALRGGVWERGGARSRVTSSKAFSRSWGAGPKPAYSSEDANTQSPAQNLGGRGTGEETFNSPWDEVPRRGFQKEPPRPWWATGNQQSEPHVYNTGSADTNPSFTGSQASSSLYNSSAWDRPSAAKRDYTRGHQLDERFEEDRLRIVAREKRLVGGAAAIVGTLAVAAGWKAMIG